MLASVLFANQYQVSDSPESNFAETSFRVQMKDEFFMRNKNFIKQYIV